MYNFDFGAELLALVIECASPIGTLFHGPLRLIEKRDALREFLALGVEFGSEAFFGFQSPAGLLGNVALQIGYFLRVGFDLPLSAVSSFWSCSMR